MLSFIIRKMWNNKWMIISLLIGNILLCSMVSSIPMYSDAILNRMITKKFVQAQEVSNSHPMTAEMKFNSTGYGVEPFPEIEKQVNGIPGEFGLGLTQKVISYYTIAQNTKPVIERSTTVEKKKAQLMFMSDFADHIKITSGRMYGNALVDGVIEVVVSENTLVEQDLIVGETMEIPNLKMPNGDKVRFVIVGIFENSSAEDLYWLYSPATFETSFFMDEALLRELFINNYRTGQNVVAQYYLMFDYTTLDVRKIDSLINKYDAYAAGTADGFKFTNFKINFEETIKEFPAISESLNITLWILQVPLFVLLAFFMFMVSKEILEQEKNTIAVMKSRGASRKQIIEIFTIQSAIVAFSSLLVGIPLGMLVCGTIGASNGFLELVARSALKVRVVPEAVIYSLTAATVSILTMVIPAFTYSKISIVDHKRGQSHLTKPFWQKFFLDFVLLAISLYGLYSYNKQAATLEGATSLASLDPLLFLSSSLFIIGAGMVFMRLFPMLVRLIFFIGRRFWSPALYTSFIKVTRSVGEESFIVLFLIMTIATGIFNAKAARTINLSIEETIRYNNGGLISVKEKWLDNRENETAKRIVYQEPDFEKYNQLDDTVKLTKVQITEGNSISELTSVTVMGIETKQFGEIAYFRSDLLPVSWYEYLNAMAQDPRAVIVSMSFHDEKGYNLGDSIYVNNENGDSFTGIIVGFVDYWPELYPERIEPVRLYTTKGFGRNIYREYVEDYNNWFVIANLAQLQTDWGVMPYEIWMHTDDVNSIYEFAEQNNITYEKFSNADSLLVAQKNDPILQGTNGVLTVSFIIVLLVCMTGFLIYWVLSIRSRELQFGIFRAMGMSMSNILTMLINEHILLSLAPILAGTLIGYYASDLFVPLIQMGYSYSDQSLPLRIIAEPGDYIKLFAIIAFMLIACVVVLGVIISKIRIAQALKLGED